MRNLLAIERSVVGVSSTEVPDLPLTAVAWDSSADSLICTHGPCEAEALIELKRVTVRFDSIQELVIFSLFFLFVRIAEREVTILTTTGE